MFTVGFIIVCFVLFIMFNDVMNPVIDHLHKMKMEQNEKQKRDSSEKPKNDWNLEAYGDDDYTVVEDDHKIKNEEVWYMRDAPEVIVADLDKVTDEEQSNFDRLVYDWRDEMGTEINQQAGDEIPARLKSVFFEKQVNVANLSGNVGGAIPENINRAYINPNKNIGDVIEFIDGRKGQVEEILGYGQYRIRIIDHTGNYADHVSLFESDASKNKGD